MLESVQQPKTTDPSDVVLIIECGAIFPAPLVHQLSSLKIENGPDPNENGWSHVELRYLVPTPHDVGTDAQLDLIEANLERITVRLLRRRDGKICALKRPGGWNLGYEREEDALWSQQLIVPSAAEFKDQGAMANEEHPAPEQQPWDMPFIRGYCLMIVVPKQPNLRHLHLVFEKYDVQLDESNPHNQIEYDLGDVRPVASQELDAAFLDRLAWE